jgi:drug/metabolite transporter (DMT)-like permease
MSILLDRISGLKYVSVVKASIIASLHPLLLVFVLRFTGEPISVMEWSGTLVSIMGMLITSAQGIYHMYHSENSDDEAVNARLELYGLLLCFVAAVCETVVILNRSQIKKHVPLMQVHPSLPPTIPSSSLQYTASTTAVIAFLASLAAVVTQSDPTSHILCAESDCLYGWSSHQWLKKILLFSFIVGVICITGFNYAVSLLSFP